MIKIDFLIIGIVFQSCFITRVLQLNVSLDRLTVAQLKCRDVIRNGEPGTIIDVELPGILTLHRLDLASRSRKKFHLHQCIGDG